MKQRIGIIYSTVDGQTRKICEELVSILNKKQIKAELYSIDTFKSDPAEFDTLIIGASIRYGKHRLSVKNFIVNNKQALKQINTAFFSVNLVARKNDKNTPETNPYLIKFFKTIDWAPDLLDVFAGKLDYKSYPFIDRIMIRLIMRITNGPTKSDNAIEYTDWSRVKDFGDKILEINKKTILKE